MSEGRSRPSSVLIGGVAAIGGLVGALIMAVVLLFAPPEWLASRVVRHGLIAEPQMLADAADALRDQQYAPVLNAYRKAIEAPFGTSWKGSEKPDVVLVEFFDYACPYCKASNAVIDRLVKEDKGLRVVYRELPILGPDSLAAARVSLAASKSGKFRQFHDALYEAGRPGPQTIEQAARASGLPLSFPDHPEFESELKRNFQLADQLGATGTPVFVVGNRVMNGAVGYETLKKAIEAARDART